MHPEMAYSLSELETARLIPNKTTVIIPTSEASMEAFMWAVFSLLLRTPPDGRMEHFMVAINGPDRRTGDPDLQNKKQAFLEELRETRWESSDGTFGKDMPISIIRAWSRVGHAESVEMCIPWVHTEFYTLMHDDVIVLNPKWCRCMDFIKSTPDCMLSFHKGLLVTGVEGWGDALLMPHPSTHFTTVHKPTATEIGLDWHAFYYKTDFCPADHKDFCKYHRTKGQLREQFITKTFNAINYEIGAWAYYKMEENGKTYVQVPEDTVFHIRSLTHTSEDGKFRLMEAGKSHIAKIERDIMRHPVYGPMYQKYKPRNCKFVYPHPPTGKPVLNVVTAVSRPKNLYKIEESLKQLTGWDVRWHLMYDGEKCKDFEKVSCWTEAMVSPGRMMGSAQRTEGFQHAQEGYVYILDDDNLIHPLFNDTALKAIAEHPDSELLLFSQSRSDGSVLPAKRVVVGQVDSGMILAKAEIARRSHFLPNLYEADYCYLKHMMELGGKLTMVPSPVCTYHNALASTSSMT